MHIGDIIPFLGILLLNLVKAQIPTGSMSDTVIPFIWFCVATIGVCVFRCASFGWRTFLIFKEFTDVEKNEQLQSN